MKSLRVAFAGLALFLACAADLPGALAEARKLSAAEIRDALSGNSVEGVWGDMQYRSYFSPNGSTIYRAKGMPPDQGKWRIDESKDQYCSWWPRSGWGCYDLYREDDRLIWGIPGTGTRYPSTLLEGKQQL